MSITFVVVVHGVAAEEKDVVASGGGVTVPVALGCIETVDVGAGVVDLLVAFVVALGAVALGVVVFE